MTPILPQAGSGAVLVESQDGQGCVFNRRPSPAVIKTWDIAPTIYALPAHTLVIGDYIVCKPDGTSVYLAAAADASSANNWFTANASRNVSLFSRNLAFVSGGYNAIISLRTPFWSNPVGTVQSWPNIQQGTVVVNTFSSTSSGIVLEQYLVAFKAAAANIMATDPASGCVFEVQLVEQDRA